MADQDKKLSEFCTVTGVSSDNAKFFLEAAKWDVQLALVNFFEVSKTEFTEELLNVRDSGGAQAIKSDSMESNFPNKKKRTDMGTLANLRLDENAQRGEAYYAGGSVSSGQQILGPDNSSNIIMDMFHAARRSPFAVGNGAWKTDETFQRQNTLTASEEQSGGRITEQSSQLVDMVLRVWSDGFTLDDGPLRNINNLKDREFINLVTSGQVPPEIAPTNGSAVRLKVEDRRFEMHTQGPRVPVPFSGQGHMLGSIIEPVQPVVNEDVEMKSMAEETPSLPVDKNLPITTIQIRLCDGQRLQVTLNHNHTIGDLRNYITTLGPQYSNGNFRLVTSFPSKELDDNNATVEQAGILNSSILLRVK